VITNSHSCGLGPDYPISYPFRHRPVPSHFREEGESPVFLLGLIQGGRGLTERGTLWERPSAVVGFAGCLFGSGLIDGGYYGLGWRMFNSLFI
jgi:hypothetical protein